MKHFPVDLNFRTEQASKMIKKALLGILSLSSETNAESYLEPIYYDKFPNRITGTKARVQQALFCNDTLKAENKLQFRHGFIVRVCSTGSHKG